MNASYGWVYYFIIDLNTILIFSVNYKKIWACLEYKWYFNRLLYAHNTENMLYANISPCLLSLSASSITIAQDSPFYNAFFLLLFLPRITNILRLFHSFIHSIIFNECLICSKHYSRYLKYICELEIKDCWYSTVYI